MKSESEWTLDGPFDCPLVHRPYDVGSVEEKIFNKLWTQDVQGLDLSADTPLFGLIGPLSLDAEVWDAVLPALLERDGQAAIWGADPAQTEKCFALKARFPGRLVRLPSSREGAATLLSSCDFLPLPRWDRKWGGLALAYGTVPLLLQPENAPPQALCAEKDAPFSALLSQALRLFGDKDAWEERQRQCMKMRI